MQIDLALPDGRSAHLRLSNALTIALGSDLVYTLDLGGRPVGAFYRGRHLRRGLDGRYLARWRIDRGPRQRAWLNPQEIEEFETDLRGDVALVGSANPARPFAVALCHARYFDALGDAAQFQRIYRPVSILPPDQYQAMVLQATEGCSFNTCTFCALYRDRAFRIKQPLEFALHIERVRDFLGEGFRLRRRIFLADANALIVPQERLIPLFDEVARTFAIMPPDLPRRQQGDWLQTHADGISGVYAFVDGLGAERKRVRDFQALHLRGLRRVYIGLESGCEELLSWLQKPSSAAAMLDAVVRMKQAGLQVGVIVLTGIGGKRFDSIHVRETAAILNRMPLLGDDIVYFSPFQSDPTAPYEKIALAEGIEPLSPTATKEQEERIRDALTLPPPSVGPKRVPYNLHDFVY